MRPLAPFLRRYVRSQILRLTLEPLKAAVETGAARDHECWPL